jgi:glutamate mutase epsilon subunit
MDKPTRWSKMISNLRYVHIPYALMKKARILTKNNKEYFGSSQKELLEIMNKVNDVDSDDSIKDMEILTKNRKIKKEVNEYIDQLFKDIFK